MTNPVFFDAACRFGARIMKFKDDARSRLHERSDRDYDNIPNVVSTIDHDVWSRRRKLVVSPHYLWLPFG
jgi:hypothetical protein